VVVDELKTIAFNLAEAFYLDGGRPFFFSGGDTESPKAEKFQRPKGLQRPKTLAIGGFSCQPCQ
jgi:hypothetical protein